MTESELLDEFRDSLDAEGDIMLPDGIARSASLVLERVDPASFRQEFLFYVDARGIDLDDLD